MRKGTAITKADELEFRVLVLTPALRDGPQVCRPLEEAGLAAHLCANMADLCAELRAGAGALILGQEAIQADDSQLLLEQLRMSPPWSDVPLLVLTDERGDEPAGRQTLQHLGESANMTLLDRPLRSWTIASAVRSALSARRRQYQVRDQLAERQQTEQALRESEEKFRTLAENARACFGIVQGEQFVYVNPYFAEVSGYAISELLSMGFPELVHPEFRPMMLERARRRQMGEPVPNHYDFMMLTKSGEARWVEFSAGTIMYKGQPAIIGTGFDITERKRATEALRQREELLRLAQQAGRVGTFVWNIRTRVLEWSPELEGLYGLQPGGFGRTYEAWAALVHPEDWPEADRRFRQALQTGLFEAEWRVIAPDDSIHWVAARGWVFKDERGQALRMVGVNICITERKKAEEALRRSEEQRRLAMKAAQMGSWDIDMVAQQCTMDERCRDIWAAPDWTTVPMDRIYERTHPDDRAAMAERLARGAAPGGSGFGEMEFRIVWPDGQVRWLRAAAHGIFSGPIGQSYALRAVGVTLDITEQKRAEQQLKDVNETLERRVLERTAIAEQRTEQLRALASELTQAEQRERRRLAQVLHDHLQQLLVGMKFGLATLKKQVDRPEPLQAIHKIGDLLDESIYTTRSLTAELSPPVLYDRGLPQALHWLASWMHDKHRLQVEVTADDDANPQSEDLRVLLYQAARELLFNVVKHAKTPHATLQATRCRQDGCIRLTVSDSGAGFDPALRAERDHTSGGFGLFSIRERLQGLGGTVEVDSSPGRGTSVTIQVPVLVDSPASSQQMPRASRTETPPVPSAESQIRILLADDHQLFRDGLARLLRMQPDLDVIGEAADGQAAIELTRRLHPDVVLMDVTLPHVSGIDATRHIAAQEAGTCVIGLSMHSEADMAAAMRDAGAAAYVTKSGSPEDLVATIRACCGRSV